jgi:hypothetical protein
MFTKETKSFIQLKPHAPRDVWDCFCLHVAPLTNMAVKCIQFEEMVFMWQCPVNRPVTCLAWDSSPFSRELKRKLFSRLCPVMDCQYSWCSLNIQSLMTCSATLSEAPHAGSGHVNGCSEPLFPSWSASSAFSPFYVPAAQQLNIVAFSCGLWSASFLLHLTF